MPQVPPRHGGAITTRLAPGPMLASPQSPKEGIMSRLFLALTGLLAAAMIALPETAAAEPPPNDHFAAATVISSLPFGDSADLTEATGEPGDPQSCANLTQTVWYSITPSTDEFVNADAFDSLVFK